ncbi:MAG: hypothetical protein RDO_1390 [Flavobacteriales endosymbiont of Rhyzopertha dominica]|nr:MAG: hypothetical protein NHG05_00480 [Candidatus Shikimatogenerans bostrichidophilus]
MDNIFIKLFKNIKIYKIIKYNILLILNKIKNKYKLKINNNKIYLYKLYKNIKNNNKYNNNKKYLVINKKIYKNIKFNNINNKKILKIKKNILINIIYYINKNKYNEYYKNIGKNIIFIVINIINKNIYIKNIVDNNVIIYKNKKNLKFKIGKLYYFLIKEINYKNNYEINIKLSRNDKLFIINLLKLEISEIDDKIIKIKKIVRIPGEKTKIVVYSKNNYINVIKTCIGVKGIKINNIIKELNNEKIEFIKYEEDINKYIIELFKPFKIKKKIIYKEKKKIKLFFEKKYISIIIGKNGINIKLTSLLLNYKIIILNNNEK